jgi:4-hydroxy-tetrahydrodipicolinate synthase
VLPARASIPAGAADVRLNSPHCRGMDDAHVTPAIEGIVAYPVTPFAADGGLDGRRLVQLIDRLIDGGAHAIAPLGSTGESAYLTDHEWDTVADASLRTIAGRIAAIVGVADLTTAGAVRRARRAEAHGADAIMVLPMSYWALSEREIVRHFGNVAGSVGLPVMVYNNPATAGTDMPPELLVDLVRRLENVTMIKESSGEIARMQRIRELTGGEVPFFNGSNPLALEAFTVGAAGWCTAAACLIPERCVELWTLSREDQPGAARELFGAMRPLLDFIIGHGGLPTTVKAALALDGFPVGDPRPPLLPLEDGARQLAACLAQARQWTGMSPS